MRICFMRFILEVIVVISILGLMDLRILIISGNLIQGIMGLALSFCPTEPGKATYPTPYLITTNILIAFNKIIYFYIFSNF